MMEKADLVKNKKRSAQQATKKYLIFYLFNQFQAK